MAATAEAEAGWIEELRRRLSRPAPRRLRPRETREAAVLVPLYVDAGQLWTVLTRRSAELPHHQSQVAFPGGGRETGEDAWEAALRETREELGIPERLILRLGQLDEAETPSGFRIIPCVGAVPYPLETEPNEEEIEEVFTIPLLSFANTQLIEDRVVRLDGDRRLLRIYHVGRHQIWGLTARILQNLMQRLGVEVADDDAPLE